MCLGQQIYSRNGPLVYISWMTDIIVIIKNKKMNKTLYQEQVFKIVSLKNEQK